MSRTIAEIRSAIHEYSGDDYPFLSTLVDFEEAVRREALREAREAVERMPVSLAVTQLEQLGWAKGRHEALDAIDALMGGSPK